MTSEIGFSASIPAASIQVAAVGCLVRIEADRSSVLIDCGTGYAAIRLASAMSDALRWNDIMERKEKAA